MDYVTKIANVFMQIVPEQMGVVILYYLVVTIQIPIVVIVTIHTPIVVIVTIQIPIVVVVTIQIILFLIPLIILRLNLEL